MLYISGRRPANIDGLKFGKVGAELDIEDGCRAVYATAVNVLATMRNALAMVSFPSDIAVKIESIWEIAD
jgi:hypothetical protein